MAEVSAYLLGGAKGNRFIVPVDNDGNLRIAAGDICRLRAGGWRIFVACRVAKRGMLDGGPGRKRLRIADVVGKRTYRHSAHQQIDDEDRFQYPRISGAPCFGQIHSIAKVVQKDRLR